MSSCEDTVGQAQETLGVLQLAWEPLCVPEESWWSCLGRGRYGHTAECCRSKPDLNKWQKMDGWIITKIRVDSKWHRQNLEILKFKIIKKLSFNYIEKQRARQKQSITEKKVSYVFCFVF